MPTSLSSWHLIPVAECQRCSLLTSPTSFQQFLSTCNAVCLTISSRISFCFFLSAHFAACFTYNYHGNNCRCCKIQLVATRARWCGCHGNTVLVLGGGLPPPSLDYATFYCHVDVWCRQRGVFLGRKVVIDVAVRWPPLLYNLVVLWVETLCRGMEQSRIFDVQSSSSLCCLRTPCAAWTPNFWIPSGGRKCSFPGNHQSWNSLSGVLSNHTSEVPFVFQCFLSTQKLKGYTVDHLCSVFVHA